MGGIVPRRILSLFRNLFRKRDIEQALDDELRSTVEVLTQEKIEQGLSQATARREALIEIGGIEHVKEEVRAVRAGHYVEVFAGDIRYALCRLRRNRSFTAVAVLTLALGIGATTAIFSVVNGILIQPLPYSHPARLVEVGSTFLASTSSTGLYHRRNTLPFASRAAHLRTSVSTTRGSAAISTRPTSPDSDNPNTCRLSA
jgi:hypothetical protein